MSTQPRLPFTAAILAGGRSLRMGRDKAGIPIAGRSLLARQIQMVSEAGAAEILLSLSSGSHPAECLPREVQIVRDRVANVGPLGGIEACLDAARQDWVVVLAVDLPEMTSGYVQALLANAKIGKGVLAEHAGRFEPLASVYTRASAEIARRQLRSNQLSLQSLARSCLEAGVAQPWRVPSDLANCLVNWNTPADWTPPGAEVPLE